MDDFHGNPCWYELATRQGKLAEAGAFYARVLGWDVTDSGMEGMTYHLARAGEAMVAGLMEMPGDVARMPPNWMIYFAVRDIDATARQAEKAGARIHRAPADIPGTGRFALLADPQGAAFGLLQPDMSQMSEAELAKALEAAPFDQSKTGHGNWHELMSSDPDAGFDFYAALFGWQKTDRMDMGEMGHYQLFSRGDGDLGAMMGMDDAPEPYWMTYFGVDGVTEAMARITSAGGSVKQGPQEVPGGVYIAIAQDPQGARFAVVGPKEANG